MKKFYPIISSLVTAVFFYVAVLLNRKIEIYKADTFNIKGSMAYEALILLGIGVCLAWNLWMLQKVEESIIALIASILISILLIVVMYIYLLEGFLYPILLIGAYGFMLIIKIFCKNRRNR